jgi:small subunit ribosomal protein S6
VEEYELVVLYHPDLEIDLDKALKKTESHIADIKGKIAFSENWGKRRLAYQIDKQDYALYVYYEITIPKDSIDTLERNFNITDEVIRYLLTKPTPNFGDRDKKPMSEESTNIEDDSSDKEKISTDDKKDTKAKKSAAKTSAVDTKSEGKTDKVKTSKSPKNEDEEKK